MGNYAYNISYADYHKLNFEDHNVQTFVFNYFNVINDQLEN
jgi:hypothetical protein